MIFKQVLKRIFWALPISGKMKTQISQKRFERILAKEKKYDEKGCVPLSDNGGECSEYVKYILSSYGKKSEYYMPYKEHDANDNGITLAAYYLTQYYPNSQNDEWWGKGTTEWNNVIQAVPQYVGHYQPKKPGELGYYDLRLKENMERQIELAHNYGINAFCFYHYWFDGRPMLEKPLNMFLNNPDLDMKFFYCWANENWTRRFSGTNDDVLMRITQTTDNYKRYIYSVIEAMKDERYYRMDSKPVLSVYRPSLIPDCEEVITEWRRIVRQELSTEIYLIAVLEKDTHTNWTSKGFDAESEFQPKQVLDYAQIDNSVTPIRKDFSGSIYDYRDLVENQKYKKNHDINRKLYPAVMPFWDNSARRNFRGTIFEGSTPALYEKWLSDCISYVKNNEKIDNLVFINAWNEWGEGAYLEPDGNYGYAYLEATYSVLNNENNGKE